MKKAILTFIIHSSFHLVLADTCFTTFERDSTNADIIFVGKLLEVNHGIYWEGGSPTSIYTFRILESFKGLSKWRSVTSIMSPVRGCCSPHFKMDSTYLVFAFAFGPESRTAYYTNDCTLTGLLNEPETQYYYNRLGEPRKPEASSDDIGRFYERKEWLLKKELAAKDSINQDQENLQQNYKNEQKKSTYLTIALALCFLIIVFFIIQRTSAKPHNKR